MISMVYQILGFGLAALMTGTTVEMTCVAGHEKSAVAVSPVALDNSCFVQPYKVITADKVYDIRQKGEALSVKDIQKISPLHLRTRTDLKDEVLWLATTGHSTRQDAALCARFKAAGFRNVRIPVGGIAAVARQLHTDASVAELVTLDKFQGYQSLANDDVMLLMVGVASKSLRKLPPIGTVFLDDAAALKDWLTQAKLSAKRKDFKFLVLMPPELGYIRYDFAGLSNVFFLPENPAGFLSFVSKMQQSVSTRDEKGYVPCAIPQS